MKRILSILLTVLMIIPNSFIVLANEKSEFYAYTTTTEGFDEYAKENLDYHIHTYYGYNDNTLQLGKGISVFEEEGYPFVLYPIWKNNRIVATFFVSYDNGQYSGSYSEGNVEQLNHAMQISSYNNPIKLVKTKDEFVYINNGIAYDMTSEVGKIMEDIDFPYFDEEKKIKVNTANVSSYECKVNTRAAASWNLPWYFTQHNPNDDYNCYAYSTLGILKNLGNTSYTFEEVRWGVSQAMNKGFMMTHSEPIYIKRYLVSEGFKYCNSQQSGSLSTDEVKSKIYNSRDYVMTGLTYEGGNLDGQNHFGVITGYYTSGSATTYNIYDPQHDGPNGKCTMSASTKKYRNSRGDYLVWDAGYVINFKK